MSKALKGILMVVAIGAIVFGVDAVRAARRPPGGGGGSCECAPLDNPVICSNGKTYANPCVAACFGATDCVPTGGGGVP